MRFNVLFSAFVVLSVSFFLTACEKNHTNDEIEQALQQYNHHLKNTDADSISLMFTEDGNLGNKVYGRDSIRKFLSQFKNIKMLSSSLITKSIVFNGDLATQQGAYEQIDLINGTDTAKAKGVFTAQWKWIHNTGWRLKSMLTTP
jgi:ketosteroid isomerase-like protein